MRIQTRVGDKDKESLKGVIGPACRRREEDVVVVQRSQAVPSDERRSRISFHDRTTETSRGQQIRGIRSVLMTLSSTDLRPAGTS